MNQLINPNLIKFSKLINSKFNYRFCSSQIYPFQNQFNKRKQLNNEFNLNKLTTRNLSFTSINYLREKPIYDENKKDVLIGEIKEKESSAKKFFREYGRLGLIVYLSVSVSTIAIIYVLLKLNFDMMKVIDFFNVKAEFSSKIEQYEEGSKFVIAYFISKILLPLRLGISMLIVTAIKMVVNRKKI